MMKWKSIGTILKLYVLGAYLFGAENHESIEAYRYDLLFLSDPYFHSLGVLKIREMLNFTS